MVQTMFWKFPKKVKSIFLVSTFQLGSRIAGLHSMIWFYFFIQLLYYVVFLGVLFYDPWFSGTIYPFVTDAFSNVLRCNECLNVNITLGNLLFKVGSLFLTTKLPYLDLKTCVMNLSKGNRNWIKNSKAKDMTFNINILLMLVTHIKQTSNGAKKK